MSATLPKSEKTKKNLLVRYIIIFVLFLLLVGLLLIVQYEDELKNKLNPPEISISVDEQVIEDEVKEDSSLVEKIPKDEISDIDIEMEGIEVEFDGFSPKELTLPVVDAVVYEVEEEETEEELSTNLNPDLDLSGPEVEQKTNFTSYNYTITLTESGLEKYGSGIRYYIDPDECLYEDMIVGEQSFEGEFTNGIDELLEINIFIQDKFIDPTKEMPEVKYEITDLDDELITSGSIQVPSCKESNEKNRYGEFSIDAPVKDLSLLQGFHHFDYYFTYDEKAKENLEEGFTYHVEAEQCLAEGMNPEDYYFVGEFPPGELNTIGFGVNIVSDSLPDDDGRLYVTSLYTINSKDGDELFSGYVQVPNCE